MNNQEAYNAWSGSYDLVKNNTRDVEAFALRETLSSKSFENVLEIGCGTGKNTAWLLTKAKNVIGADFSDEMLAQAKAKINADNVEFIQTDIRETWKFANQSFDLITCSLILEHIENIDFVFNQASAKLKPGGEFYIGELHPFKQYSGTKARFDTDTGQFVLECFTHHVSDYFDAAKNNGFDCVSINEWFDDNDRTAIPRILTMKFQSKK
jgi:ubiquinone/menaquinone biosynthesis C-methylase UbiE